MYVLAIDTSNQSLGVALLEGDRLIAHLTTNIAKNHSEWLMPAINQLMEEIQLTPDELEKIIVAKGPGSYTGVRIGLSTAKSMAWALDIPIIGVSSLEVLAWQGRFFHGYVCPFFDARRGMVYTGLYRWKNDRMVSVEPDINILMDEWLTKLTAYQEDILFLSPDIETYQTAILQKMGGRAVIPDGPFGIANASHLAWAGMHKQAESVHHLTPSYLRLAEAEAKWIKKQKERQENG